MDLQYKDIAVFLSYTIMIPSLEKIHEDFKFIPNLVSWIN